MPKNKKKAESSSDSDEGPIDRGPVDKKAKIEDPDSLASWVLSGKKLVKIRTFKGKVYIDIREHYEKNGAMLPGKKGISLNAEDWRKLMSLGDEITSALSKSC